MIQDDIRELREREYRYCKSNLEYFIDTYGHIQDHDSPDIIEKFSLWEDQRKALRTMASNKHTIILKARQLGLTWLVLHYAVHLLLFTPGRVCVGVSQTEDYAKELVSRMAFMLSQMPELIADREHQPAGWTGPVYYKTTLTLTIDRRDNMAVSEFKCFASSPSVGRSITADLLIMDEWAFQAFAREIWASAFPIINRPNSGQVIGISTIDRGSLFEELFLDDRNDFAKVFIPWYADPRRDKAWYENSKITLGDKMTSEYPATIDEALTVPGGQFFPEVTEKTHITNDIITGRNYVCIDYGLDMLSAHWVTVDENKKAQVYREYDSPNLTIGAACDILNDLSSGEDIDLYLAPPDLWNRSQESGKSRAALFEEGGINLTMTSNDYPAGCAAMKEWLLPRNGKANLTIYKDSAPNLYKCLREIQKDKRRANVYAKDPHNLTHDPDSLRCFCVYWTKGADKKKSDDYQKRKKIWTSDLREDYMNASKKDKAYLVKKYGEPVWD